MTINGKNVSVFLKSSNMWAFPAWGTWREMEMMSDDVTTCMWTYYYLPLLLKVVKDYKENTIFSCMLSQIFSQPPKQTTGLCCDNFHNWSPKLETHYGPLSGQCPELHSYSSFPTLRGQTHYDFRHKQKSLMTRGTIWGTHFVQRLCQESLTTRHVVTSFQKSCLTKSRDKWHSVFRARPGLVTKSTVTKVILCSGPKIQIWQFDLMLSGGEGEVLLSPTYVKLKHPYSCHGRGRGREVWPCWS